MKNSRAKMQRLTSIYFTGQFGRFLVAGGIAATANFASRFAFEATLGFTRAVLAAYGVGFVVAFLLNKRYVFPASGKPISQEIAWFFLFNILALPVTLGASFGLHRYVFSQFLAEGTSKAVSHGVAIILPTFVNFVAHKLVTFGRRSATSKY